MFSIVLCLPVDMQLSYVYDNNFISHSIHIYFGGLELQITVCDHCTNIILCG